MKPPTHISKERGFTIPPTFIKLIGGIRSRISQAGGMRRTGLRKTLVGGFTLVELIVSMGLFIVVVFGTTSAMLTMLDANRKAQAMRTAMEGLGFALDDIARSVRVGGDYECLSSLPPTSADPVFTPSNTCLVGVKIKMDAGVVAYYFEGGTIKKTFIPTSGVGGYSGLVLTPPPPELTISTATFGVLGNQTTDQPRIIIVFLGTAGDKPGFQSTFHVQTVVTARLPGAVMN